MNKAKIVSFANMVAELGRTALSYKEGVVAFKLILWTMEMIDAHHKGEIEELTPEDVNKRCDELMKEAENG